MTRYRIAPDARTDLDEIRQYIAEDSAAAAARVLRRFRQVFRLLAANPALGHRRQDLTTRPLLFFAVFSYLVVYSPESRPLRIVRVLSAARDIDAIIG